MKWNKQRDHHNDAASIDYESIFRAISRSPKSMHSKRAGII